MPRLLDLFCGAGGCSVGYARAGFEVVGVDNRPQPRYPFEFHRADAMTYPLDGVDVVHASPPCQDHSSLKSMWNARDHGTGWMLDATRERLRAWGGPWVIENVPGAAMDRANVLVICGAAMGLAADGYQLRRHRQFESNVWLMGPPCSCRGRTLGVYGHGGNKKPTPGVYGDLTRNQRGTKASIDQARRIMGIDWMTTKEICQAIPPAYTEHIGWQLLAYLEAAA